jgi:precorrin-6Y C5,15-methyltransferase (decarboxylating)
LYGSKCKSLVEITLADVNPAVSLHVIGTDAGGVLNLPQSLQFLIKQAALVAAPSRLAYAPSSGQQLISTDHPAAAIEAIAAALATSKPTVLLASGDPLWFGIGRLLLQRFEPAQLCFHPAPSSMQLAFAGIARPWQDASWISLQGREPEALAAELQKRPAALIVLTDPNRGGAESVRLILRASGLEAAYGFWLCEIASPIL